MAQRTSAREQHWTRRILVTVAAAAMIVVGAALPAHAGHSAIVGNTDGDGLRVRQGPNTSSAVVAVVQTGQTLDIDCQAYGTWVTNTRGFSSNLWDHSSGHNGYVSDAYMNTGYDGRIPGIPLCDSPPNNGSIIPLQQNQGQTTQWEDCGPTSIVVALHAIGYTPHGWNASWPVESIHRAREDMGLPRNVPSGGTNEAQVAQAFSTYGLSSTISGNLNTILTHVRNGGAVVLAGNTVDLPWPVNVSSPNGVPHFLAVVGYAGDGNYYVVDPIAIQNTVKTASAGTLGAYFDHHLGRLGVMVG